jgi:DNA primase
MTILQDHKKKQRIFKSVVSICQHLLQSPLGSSAREYLDKRLDIEDQLKWKFGYFPDDKNLHELTSLIKKEDLELINLYYPKFLAGGTLPHGHFADHNLVMPFHNVHNEIVSLLGRTLIESEEERRDRELQKYKYSSGSQKDLYVFGLNKAKDSIIENNFVIGVEGQFDCISLHTQGITNSIAFGWANMSKFQLFQLHRYTNNIILMFDNDEAGQKAKGRVKTRYKDCANIKVCSPPKGFKDIDQFFRECTDLEYKRDVIFKIKNLGEKDGWKN